MPFDRVLVPLDGSRLAEAGLAIAKPLARSLGSVLVLVHVVERDPPTQIHGDRHLTTRGAAEDYLDLQRGLCAREGLRSETYVASRPEPDVARVIVELAGELRTDLVAMCAHGRRSLMDRLLGPIAQRVLQGGGPPVLLRTAGTSPEAAFELRTILLAIDFRHDLNPVLDDVTDIATSSGAAVVLLNSTDAGETGLPARMLPNTSFELSPRREEAARERLHILVQQLKSRGVSADAVVTTEDPQDAIIDEARSWGVDLVVLITNGRSGVTAWYERSVGRRIIQEQSLNLLLFRGSRPANQA